MDSGGTSRFYAYDAICNLTCIDGAATGCANQGYGVPGHVHAIAHDKSGTIFSYDANGNLTGTSTGRVLQWSGDNQLEQVKQGTAVLEESLYLGEHRWKKLEAGVVTYYLPGLRIDGGQARTFTAASPSGVPRTAASCACITQTISARPRA
jgi:hypothetical protein